MAGTAYEIRIIGLVPAEVLRELGNVTVTAQELRTVLTGRFTDQAALHGFLLRLRAFDLDLVEMRSLAPVDDEEPPEEAP